MENSNPLSFYNHLKEELAQYPGNEKEAIEKRNEVKIKNLTFMLDNLKGMYKQEPPRADTPEIQEKVGEQMFLLLPDTEKCFVETILFPNGQKVSREKEVPKEIKQTWNLSKVDNYRKDLLKLNGKVNLWKPIV